MNNIFINYDQARISFFNSYVEFERWIIKIYSKKLKPTANAEHLKETIEAIYANATLREAMEQQNIPIGYVRQQKNVRNSLAHESKNKLVSNKSYELMKKIVSLNEDLEKAFLSLK